MEEAVRVAEVLPAAPPPRRPRRSDDLIPPPKRKQSNSLIPPPPAGADIKKVPDFTTREIKGAVIWFIVIGGSSVIVSIIMGCIGWWGFRNAKLPPLPAPPELKAPAQPEDKKPPEGKARLAPRDHGPAPPFEEWAVREEHKLEHKDGIWNAAVTADGKTLATTSNSFLRLWDLSAQPPVEKASMRMPGGRSTALGFSPDGKTLLMGVTGNTLRVLDVSGAKITERQVMRDWAGNVWSVAYSPDGKTLAVGADDMTIWLYDVTGAYPKERTVFKVQNTALGVKGLFWTPDGRRLIHGTGAGAVRLWYVEAREPKELAADQGPSDTFLLPMSLAPDGKLLAVARGKTVHLLDVSDAGFAEWMKLDKHREAMRAVAFSPDGKLLATTGVDGQIIVWKVGLDKPVLVKQRAKTFCEVLFVPRQTEPRVVACNWNTGTIYLFKIGPAR
jgi:WD40 repeat protein